MARRRIAAGLVLLDIDPREIRTDVALIHEDLCTLVQGWPRKQLSALRRILRSDLASRAQLLAYITGALNNHA